MKMVRGRPNLSWVREHNDEMGRLGNGEANFNVGRFRKVKKRLRREMRKGTTVAALMRSINRREEV